MSHTAEWRIHAFLTQGQGRRHSRERSRNPCRSRRLRKATSARLGECNRGDGDHRDCVATAGVATNIETSWAPINLNSVTTLFPLTGRRTTSAIVPAIPRTELSPSRPTPIVGSFIVGISCFLAAKSAHVTIKRVIGVSELLAGSYLLLMNVTRRSCARLSHRSGNQQNAKCA